MSWWVLFGEGETQFTATPSDNLLLTEIVRLVVSRQLPEAVGLTELLATVLGRRFAEAVSLSESLTRQVQVRRAEILATTESVRKQVDQLVASETIGLAEGLTAIKVSTATLADTLATTEALAKSAAIRLADAVLLTEGLAKAMATSQADISGLTEMLTITPERITAEQVVLTENLAAIRVVLLGFAEALGFAENTIVEVRRRQVEAVALNEQLQVSLLPGDITFAVIRLTKLALRVPELDGLVLSAAG